MKQKIENLILQALKSLDIEAGNFSVEHPEDFKNGDYSTNVAMVCAKNLKMNLRELAEKISAEIFSAKDDQIEKVEVAGAGFINFYLSREFFSNSIKEIIESNENWGSNEILKNKKVMVEYTQPNPFKPFHIGHLMSNAIGESISRIVEFSGAKVVRANYQGDVGPHVAKAIYGMQKAGAPADESASSSVLAQYIGECYSKGSDAYDNDGDAKKEIDEINKKVYDRSDEEINKIYDWGRKVTLEAFEEIYKTLGTKFDYYFFESIMAPIGEKIVRENVGKIFEESDGAIVFKAENYNPKLHTRVFINSKGLPTYETKEIGLTITKFEKENPDISIVTTAIEQAEYMKVVEQAIAIMHPEIQSRMKHITHGMMRLATGKMSSRKGNVVTGESLLRDSMDVVLEKIKDREFTEDEKKKLSEIVGVSALKYSILRSSLGSDIVYDFEKSISFEGDSGPYLQYSAIRAKSILAKALGHTSFSDIPNEVSDLEKVLYRFPEVVSYSYQELEPNHIATYLINLASTFNSFYAQTQILNTKDKYSHYYVGITKAFLSTMQNGLWLLGISLPERM
jgi:arginyl-tRNA synthetase